MGATEFFVAELLGATELVVAELLGATELVVAELLAKTAPSAGLSHDAGYSALPCC